MDDKIKTLANYNFWDGNVPELGVFQKKLYR